MGYEKTRLFAFEIYWPLLTTGLAWKKSVPASLKVIVNWVIVSSTFYIFVQKYHKNISCEVLFCCSHFKSPKSEQSQFCVSGNIAFNFCRWLEIKKNTVAVYATFMKMNVTSKRISLHSDLPGGLQLSNLEELKTLGTYAKMN